MYDNFKKLSYNKNMKSEKGMTLVATVAFVIVITALVFAVVYYARIEIAKSNLEDLKTDILLVQAKVKTISGEYILQKDEELLKGTKIEDMKDDPAIKQVIEKEEINIDEEGKKYYVLNKENLQELNLENVKLEENNYYIVEYTAYDVYYTKGFLYSDGEMYYKLTAIENLVIEENE